MFKDKGLLWAWEDGIPHSPDYLYKQFKKLLKKAALPDMRVHDLRHSYATLLRDQGVDMATISEMLGHYSSSFTHSVYAHPTGKTQQAVAKAMNSLLGYDR